MDEWQQAFSLIPWQDRSMVVFFALLVNYLVGQAWLLDQVPRGLWPAQWQAKLLRFLEVKLNRPERSAGDIMFRGGFALAYPVLVALAAGLALSRVHLMYPPHGWMVEPLVLGLVLRWRYARDMAVYAVAYHQDVTLDQLRRNLQAITRLRTETMDTHGLFRMCAEETTLAFGERLVGACLWYVILGLPGALTAVAVAEAHALLGRPCRELRAFGQPVRVLYRIMLTPALWLAGGMLALVSVGALQSTPFKAWQAALQWQWDGRNYLWRVMAQATGIQLGGKTRVLRYVTEQGWVGDGEAKMDFHHVKRVLAVENLAVLLWLLLTGGVFYVT